jgi:hypothetical protein
MPDETELAALRAHIASLSLALQSKETLGVVTQIHKAFNQLANLTAKVFVVVYDGCSIEVYGVSPEVNCTSAGSLLLFLTEDGRRIKVRGHFLHGSYTIFLDIPGRICFEIEEGDDGHLSVFTLTAFTTREAATDFARNAQK